MTYTYRRTLPAFLDDHAPGFSSYSAVGSRYRVLCSDGRVRTATATADADSVYTIPARVSVNGRTVTGSVYHRGNLDYSRAGWPEFDASTPEYRFTAYTYRRNGDALPAWAPSVNLDGSRARTRNGGAA